MSKPSSGHFSGTTGSSNIGYKNSADNGIISTRTSGLDLREHPVKNYSKTSVKKIKEKIGSRTATKQEYKKLSQSSRLSKRRKQGVKQFWEQERLRILSGQKTTRNWSAEQLNDIISNRTPKYKGRSIQGHHTYSVSRYPHLANKGEIIFPTTFYEHLYGWHGGNFKNTTPGKPFKKIKEF